MATRGSLESQGEREGDGRLAVWWQALVARRASHAGSSRGSVLRTFNFFSCSLLVPCVVDQRLARANTIKKTRLLNK